MLTPQEIQETKFEKAVFGGYDMAQIDKFLDELLVDYTLLYKENAALKGKMRVLVDKIDEYRAVDEEMRKALYTAQITAKEITDKANADAEIIRLNAEADAKKRAESVETEIYAQAVKLREMRTICDRYAQTVKALMQKAADDIALTESRELDELIGKTIAENARKERISSFDISLPDDVAVEPAVEEEPIIQPVEEPTIEIEVEEIEEEIIEEETSEEVEAIIEEKPLDFNLIDDHVEEKNDEKEQDEEEDKTFRPRFNFADLKFGKNYKNQD